MSRGTNFGGEPGIKFQTYREGEERGERKEKEKGQKKEGKRKGQEREERREKGLVVTEVVGTSCIQEEIVQIPLFS